MTITIVVGFALTYLLHSTLLLGAAWIADRFMEEHESWRETMWKAALLGAVGTAALATWMPKRVAVQVDVARAMPSLGRAVEISFDEPVVPAKPNPAACCAPADPAAPRSDRRAEAHSETAVAPVLPASPTRSIAPIAAPRRPCPHGRPSHHGQRQTPPPAKRSTRGPPLPSTPRPCSPWRGRRSRESC